MIAWNSSFIFSAALPMTTPPVRILIGDGSSFLERP